METRATRLTKYKGDKTMKWNATNRTMICLVMLSVGTSSFAEQPGIFHAQGEMAGEVDIDSVILQSRLTASKTQIDDDVPGCAGIARFEISINEEFRSPRSTGWLTAHAANDFVVKARIEGLKPHTTYFYRLIFGPDKQTTQQGETCSFRTLQGKHGTDEVSFVVVTGMNYMSFHFGKASNGRRTGKGAYTGEDKQLGFPALATIANMKPDFFVGTGDNVYYDSHDDKEAIDIRGIRRKWHEQFVQPRFVELFRHVPTYWEKDDHDHRFNDCDRTGERPPLSDLGIRIFREQVPIVNPAEPNATTYRTYRVNRHLQVWLVEGRDYRSPNRMPDGPDKTLWGKAQLDWLKRTLKNSDATWKLLISPTPLVGPDDGYKIDNHTNHRGFRQEGRAFLNWVKENELDRNGLYLICGDRHWQYHSIDPTGVEEFSCGALVDSNARLGRNPGDPKSTDPNAEIQQVYTQAQASGGFLRVRVTSVGAAHFEFFDENGKSLYRTKKQRPEDLGVLDSTAPTLVRDHLLGTIREQYAIRRRAVEESLKSREAFRHRQNRLRESLRRIIGELPDKTPLQPQVTGTITADGYRVEKVVYQSRPHHYVTANLYVPSSGEGPFPGVLIACGHSSLGKAYEPYQRAAMLMARNGMVALVYDPIGQGERLSYLQGSTNPGLQHKLDNVNAVLVGRTAVGYQAWDGIRSLDYLLSRPEVDSNRPVGMTGNSGGGAQTMYLMALDDRIGPAAPSCHITTLERNFELGGPGDGCQSAPLTGAEGIDHPDFFTIRAPRPSIILSAEQDYKDIRFTRKTFAEAQRVYELLEMPERIDMFAYDDRHAFSQPRRQAATRWMRRWLLNDERQVTETATPIQPEEALRVTRSGQVLREYADALSVSALNCRRAKELSSSRTEFWNSRDRQVAVSEIAELIGFNKESTSPHVSSLGVINRGEYRIEKLSIGRRGEPLMPALLFRPHRLIEKTAAVLYVDGRGKQFDAAPGGEIERLVKSGQIVLSIDVRGLGETRDEQRDVIYDKGDHRLAMWSMHIGKPLLGQRVEDVSVAAGYLSSLSTMNSNAVEVVGIGQAGPVVLHAAALDDKFAKVTLRNSITSWIEGVVEQPRDQGAISHVVPSALHKYDLPDLAELLEDRLVVQ